MDKLQNNVPLYDAMGCYEASATVRVLTKEFMNDSKTEPKPPLLTDAEQQKLKEDTAWNEAFADREGFCENAIRKFYVPKIPHLSMLRHGHAPKVLVDLDVLRAGLHCTTFAAELFYMAFQTPADDEELDAATTNAKTEAAAEVVAVANTSDYLDAFKLLQDLCMKSQLELFDKPTIESFHDNVTADLLVEEARAHQTSSERLTYVGAKLRWVFAQSVLSNATGNQATKAQRFLGNHYFRSRPVWKRDDFMWNMSPDSPNWAWLPLVDGQRQPDVGGKAEPQIDRSCIQGDHGAAQDQAVLRGHAVRPGDQLARPIALHRQGGTLRE